MCVLIGRLLSLIDGHILEVILKHDGSRMIQSCLAHGDEQQRQKVYKELQGMVVVDSNGAFCFVCNVLSFCHLHVSCMQDTTSFCPKSRMPAISFAKQ